MRPYFLYFRQVKKSRQERRAAHNIGFALWGLTYFYDTFVQEATFMLRINSSAKNPPQRKAVNRQVVKKLSF